MRSMVAWHIVSIMSILELVAWSSGSKKFNLLIGVKSNYFKIEELNDFVLNCSIFKVCWSYWWYFANRLGNWKRKHFQTSLTKVDLRFDSTPPIPFGNSIIKRNLLMIYWWMVANHGSRSGTSPFIAATEAAAEATTTRRRGHRVGCK